MKVQSKITLLLLAVVATFMAGLWSFRVYDRHKFARIAADRDNERKQSFDAFLKKDGEPLKTLAEYDGYWDDMVQAVATKNQRWFEEFVNDTSLMGYKANAVWIYGPDAELVYSKDSNNDKPPDLPVPANAFPKIFEVEPFSHFFVKMGNDVVEIRGATIHGSKELGRQTPSKGYFFVGRLWNQPALDEMALYSSNQIELLPAREHPRVFQSDEKDGVVVFSQKLTGWDDKPVAELVVRNESPVVRELNRSSERLWVTFCAFAIVLLLLLSLSLVRWVTQPLRQIMESLKRNDARPIEKLCSDNSEFGEMARTAQKFFEQRDNLIREMEERRVTEEALRKSEEELRHSQKMEAVGRLAGGVAHDFNNLLTAIIGYAELIANRTSSNSLAKQNAELIGKAGEQAAALTRQLLAFSRKQILQPKVIDLNSLVGDMEKLLRRVIGERFDLQSHPKAGNGRVKADPTQLEQVVLNLGVNARDAMPRGGKLIIRTENVRLDRNSASHLSVSPGDYVMLSVTDTGAGMTEETKSHIFEPFFTTKGPGKGTGLGLATVYGIVRQTGGGISVESEPGKGSTFRIYLPQVSAPVDFTRGH